MSHYNECGCGGHKHNSCNSCTSHNEIQQAVNDALAFEKENLEQYENNAAQSASDAANEAAKAAESASAAAQSQTNAETAAGTATQAASSVTDTAIVLEETAERLEQAQDLLEEQISAIHTKPVYFEVSTPTSSLVLPETETVFNVRSIYVASARQDVGYGFTFDKATRTITLAKGITAEAIAEIEEGFILVTAICDVYSSDDPTSFPIILASNVGANNVGTSTGDTVETRLATLDSQVDPTLRQNLASSEYGLGASLVALKERGTVQDALLKIYSPEMFGAIGDGITDDTAALQSMFSAVAASGYCCVRLSGRYVYTAPLECHYIVSANYGVTFEGITPWASFIWRGAAGQNTLNLTMSIHGYRLVMRDILFLNDTGESNFDVFTAIRLSGEEHRINNLAFRGKWKVAYWGVIQHLSVIEKLNIQNDTRPASDSSVDPIGIGIRLNSCLNTTLVACKISFTNYAWMTGYLEPGQTRNDILPASYSGTIGYDCEGISFIECGGTSNYRGVTLKGVDMKMIGGMIDITKYTWLGVYGEAIVVDNVYFGVVGSYDYGDNSRFYVDGSGVYGLDILNCRFIGGKTNSYQAKAFIPNTAHYVNIDHNYLSYAYIGVQTTTGKTTIGDGNKYDGNTSQLAVMAAATFGISDYANLGNFIRYGGQLYVGRNAADAGGKLVVQAEGVATQRGILVTQAGARLLTTALGNAGITAAPTTNDAAMNFGAVSGNGRSITAVGTINASGADYAEYFVKSDGCGEIKPGDIAGVNADGQLTQKFSESVHFLIKSTNPSYVGGDTWSDSLPARPEFSGSIEELNGINEDDETTYSDDFRDYKKLLRKWEETVETARQRVDRMALCGQVPVNIIGGKAGQYLIPVPGDEDAISGVYVSESEVTFEQFKLSIGRVVSVSDGIVTLLV
nr:MAG TPA: tail spike protein [Caudoviricetes sp.]